MRLRDKAAWLFIVVCVVVACAFVGNKFRVENVATVGRPVFCTKDVVIDDSSMHDDERLGAKEFVLERHGEDYLFGFLLAMFDSFKTLNNLAVRKDGSGCYLVVGMPRTICEIQRLSPHKDSYHDIAVHIFGWSLTRIHDFRRDKERFVDAERDYCLRRI
jgi:hypothetical protein